LSSDNLAIRVRNLGKKYQIGGPKEKYLTIRDAIVNSVKAPFARFKRDQPSKEFWALKDLRPDVGKRILCVGHMRFSTTEPTSYLP
jgi:lipopolysaccharide transport system ATP-binding protein